MRIRVAVLPNGNMEFIHSDALAGLMAQGDAQVSRASDVEPNEAGEWVADMAKSGGPALPPQRLRRDALAAEVAWLEENFIGKQKGSNDAI